MTQTLKAMNIVNFNSFYDELLFSTTRHGIIEENKRTGSKIAIFREISTSFIIDLSTGILPVLNRRRTYPSTAAAEIAWFLQGTQDASFILSHAKRIWEKFLEPNTEKVKNSYGYRWRKHFKRDQILEAILALRDNASDRRVYVSAWDPSIDGLTNKNDLNVPCPVGFNLAVANNKLYSALFLRSSDLFMGLPYDIMGHSMLMAAIAKSVGTKLGSLHVSIGHAHIYESHFELVDKYLVAKKLDMNIPIIQNWSILDIETEPHAFVDLYKSVSKYQSAWPEFNPRPEIVV